MVARPQVLEKAKRRQFSAEYKQRILEEADRCTKPGELGALLRREGLYSSLLSIWRKQRDRGALNGLTVKKRGRKRKHRLQIEIDELRREKERLKKKLETAELVIDFQKKTLRHAGDSAGRDAEQRARVTMVRELSRLTGIRRACETLAVPRVSYYREQNPKESSAASSRRSSFRRIPDAKRSEVIEIMNSEEFQDLAPPQIYTILLERGDYHCSERSMYRILAENRQARERRNQRRHPEYQKPELLATRPDQIWTWDITKLKSTQKWVYFYLYVMIDIFSRYVVGWLLAHSEQSDLAARLIRETTSKQQVEPDQLVIHADRGPSMTSKTVAQLLEDLRVERSHSRPYHSEDNPFSESQFKTMKYRPVFPDRFASFNSAHDFCRHYFPWYNHEHRHSGIAMLTPASVHCGQTSEILAQRDQTLQKAYRQHPERFVNGPPKTASIPDAVWLNPPVDRGDGKEVLVTH